MALSFIKERSSFSTSAVGRSSSGLVDGNGIFWVKKRKVIMLGVGRMKHHYC